MEPDRIVRLPEASRITGLPRPSLYKAMQDGLLERPLRLGLRSVGWRLSYLMRWLDERAKSGPKVGR